LEVIHNIEKIESKGWLFLTIYQFPDKKKKTRKQETTDILVEKVMKNVKEYESKPDYFIEAFKRKLRDIGKF
jgi:hypothetical protein